MSEFDGIIRLLVSARLRTSTRWEHLRRYEFIQSSNFSQFLIDWISFWWLFKDVDECLVEEGICEDGSCVNTEGGVRCECPRGYILSADGRKCVDVREELCFNSFRRNQCSEPRMTTMTRTQCCCTMGAAWGNGCDQCPSEGTGTQFIPFFVSQNYFYFILFFCKNIWSRIWKTLSEWSGTRTEGRRSQWM